LARRSPGDKYCWPCKWILKRRPAPRKSRKRWDGLCPRCRTNVRGAQPYCPKCKLDYQNETRAKKWAERYATNPAKKMETSRAYATGLLQRRKIRRGLCVFCGASGTQFHHYDYERKTRNFEDVCDQCHTDVHRFLKTLLTAKMMLL
jgi:hypothetical protein